MTTALPTVLVIEDEAELADTYREFLEGEYTVRTAYGGKRGLTKLDEDVDLVLLDRRMPNYSGEEVLTEIRSRDYDCQVAMLTAVDPDVDIVDMPFDEYVVKPIGRDELLETVEQLVKRSQSEHNNEVLNALGDQKARHILSYLVDDAVTAKELETATGYSLATVYRRLNTLNQLGLIEEQTQITADGNHFKTFTAVADRVCVDIAEGFQVDIHSAEADRE